MTTFLTRRFVLTSLVMAAFACLAAFAISHREAPNRAWVAGHAVPCTSLGAGHCDAKTSIEPGAN